ncbi:MAG: hypothetical protein CMN47_02515 [SAR116 cluster bacterium]|jgi:hypothetical protein|nr:hypothetical protein [SAR116 cluster bacterium]
MNARHLPSLLLVTTVGTVLLLDPFAQNFMSSSTPVLIEGNNTSFKTIPDKGTDDDFKDLLNVIKAFQSGEPYDRSICFCGFYAEYLISKLEERIATGEVTREQVDRFCALFTDVLSVGTGGKN